MRGSENFDLCIMRSPQCYNKFITGKEELFTICLMVNFDSWQFFPQATSARLNTSIQAVVMGLSSFILAFIYSWKLTLLVLAFVPFMLMAGMYVSCWRKGSKSCKESQNPWTKTLTFEIISCPKMSLTKWHKFDLKQQICQTKNFVQCAITKVG